MCRTLYGLIVVFFLPLSGLQAQSADRPALPEKDYGVITAVVNEFSDCTDMNRAHLRGGLVFVSGRTEEPDSHRFRLEVGELERLEPLITGNRQFFKNAAWDVFLQSVEATQFGSCQVQTGQIKPLSCRRVVEWTPQLLEKYFPRGGLGKGYDGLRADYHAFVEIASVSRVVYSADGTKAICYFAKTASERSGEGSLVFLEQQGSYWQVVAKLNLWIS